MTELKTEEEQIAALKKWWSDNGKSLLIGIGVALAIVFGWKAYQNNLIQTKAEASSLYQQLIAEATKNNFDDEEVDTLGGLVFMLIGRIPAKGEIIEHPNGVEFEVVDTDPRRIKRLRVTRNAGED